MARKYNYSSKMTTSRSHFKNLVRDLRFKEPIMQKQKYKVHLIYPISTPCQD